MLNNAIFLKFLVQTPDIPSRTCGDKPEFVAPTPDPSDVVQIPPGDTLYISAYATSPGAK